MMPSWMLSMTVSSKNYDYVGNYLILLIHDAYDIPGKTSDGIEMEDAL